ncbi:MAG: hypothetical protein FWG92_05370 [Leptospirales bacterium]|nr:hypothetical protein [Leptospirales bacterium]
MSKEQTSTVEILDPFYSEANQAKLARIIADIESGKANLTAHELIEVDDDEDE